MTGSPRGSGSAKVSIEPRQTYCISPLQFIALPLTLHVHPSGYPVEESKGWSSPAFVIRSVKDKGVPYKFIVPELDKFKQQ